MVTTSKQVLTFVVVFSAAQHSHQYLTKISSFTFDLVFITFHFSLIHLCLSSLRILAPPLHLDHDRLLRLEEPLHGFLMAALRHVHPVYLRLKSKSENVWKKKGQFDAMSSDLLEDKTKRLTGVWVN